MINIEMQVENLSEYVNRTILYTAQISSEGLEKGQEYNKLKKTIHISIIKGNLKLGSRKYHGIYRYMEIEDRTELSDIAEIHYLKLDELPEKPLEETTPVEQLGFYLMHAGDPKRQKEIEQLLLECGEAIVLTDEVLRKASAEEILREKELARKRWLLAQAAQKREIEAQSREQGLKRGLNQGLKQGRNDILRLIARMTESGQASEIPRLSEDQAFLEEKLKEYDLV